MTLQEALNILGNLKTETSKKYEIKVYDRFLYILNGLGKREFSKDELQLIEIELDSLHLESKPKNRKKYFKKALSKFEKYLKDKFSLTSKGYYTNMYGGVGLSFGLLFGIILFSKWERSLGISMGLLFGMLIGSTIGKFIDAKAIREDRVL